MTIIGENLAREIHNLLGTARSIKGNTDSRVSAINILILKLEDIARRLKKEKIRLEHQKNEKIRRGG